MVSLAGGRQGGGSRLTAFAQRQIQLFHAVETEYQRFLQNPSENIHDVDAFLHFMRRLSMQTSARNQFVGRVVSLKTGPINAEVTVDLGGANQLTALITTNSADHLGLKEGSEVFALFKASSIIIVPGSGNIKLSARNQLRGTIASCKKGAINAEVIIQFAADQSIVAIITNESLEKLGLKEGDQASAVFKASSVILGVAL